MRQQHLRHVAVLARMMLPQPANLRGGVAGHHRVSGELDAALAAAAILHDLVRFLLRRRIAPQLYRVQDLAIAIYRHETMLLPGNRNRAHRHANTRADLLQCLVQCRQPPARFLFGPAGRIACHFERRGSRGDDFASLVVIEKNFQALCAEIYTESRVHRVSSCPVTRRSW